LTYEIHSRSQAINKSSESPYQSDKGYPQTPITGGLFMNVKKLVTRAVIACGVIGAEALFTFILNRKKMSA
jgi:hypothetical protein